MQKLYRLASIVISSSILIIFLLLSAQPSFADEIPLTPEQKETLQPLVDAANKASIQGPATIQILDQASLDLPKGYSFVPKQEAEAMMNAFGHSLKDSLIGLITSGKFTMPDEPSPKDEDWMISLEFVKSGYVRDDDAKSWNPDKLLKTIQENAEKENAAKASKGFPTIEDIGWAEPPTYDAIDHQLIFAVDAKLSGLQNNDPPVNYETITLGREGLLGLNLVTTHSQVVQDKKHALEILSAIHYAPGKRYEDFVASNDRVAEFGLAALVTGVAAKKLGLFALIGVFLVKGGKLLILVVIVFLAKIRKILKRKPPTT